MGEWIHSQPLPEEEKDTLLASAAAAAVPDDPRAALDWLLAHARPEAAAESLNALTRRWADASPNDCGEWLRTLPPSPTTDAALMAFVDEVRDHDAESAFQWTRRFNNPEQRRTFAVSTWEKWQTLAPVSAARFASQLDPQERAWLKLGGAR